MPVCQLPAQNISAFLSEQGARLHLPAYLVVRDSCVMNSYQSSVAKAGERDQAAGAYSNWANRDTRVLKPGSWVLDHFVEHCCPWPGVPIYAILWKRNIAIMHYTEPGGEGYLYCNLAYLNQ